MTEERTSANSLALLDPQYDMVATAFYLQALSALEYAEKRVIKTIEDMKPASDDLNLIRKLKKAMEARRKDYLEPFQTHIKEVNDGYKRFMAPVEAADRITSEKMLAFTAEQERIRREQERINTERMKLAEAEMKLNGEMSESVSLIEVLLPAPTTIRTELGSTGLVKLRKWEVEDLSKVPLDYLMIDAAKVGKVVRAGIPSIPGIRIWQEETLRTGTNRF